MADDEKVEEFFQHFGVMGMRWGVRNDKDRVPQTAAEKRASDKRRAKNIGRVVNLTGAAIFVALMLAPLLAGGKGKGSRPVRDFSKPSDELFKPHKGQVHKISPNARSTLMRQERERNAAYQARMRGAREVKGYLKRTGQDFF